MSFSSTTPLLPPSTLVVSQITVNDIETKLNYIFRDKCHLMHALGAEDSTFWTSARIWSNQAMLRSNYLDTSTESLLRAAEYLNLPNIAAESVAEASTEILCRTVKSILVAVYMDCSDQRMVHHAAEFLALYVAFPLGKIELTREQMEGPSNIKRGKVVKQGDVATPGVLW